MVFFLSLGIPDSVRRCVPGCSGWNDLMKDINDMAESGPCCTEMPHVMVVLPMLCNLSYWWERGRGASQPEAGASAAPLAN
ncbi:ryanodine receptor 3-like protein [Lates japonicus]|uniref:Ryanodine receptor 3-like protein n=1 Tax=Lates japonicus TaxID=270547 RepID=A0AAD3NKX3_LATJO|nr:ryanodine receptor 3-like protein [Lates japonicus]